MKSMTFHSRNPLNKAVLAWVVFDGAAKGVRTAVRGLLASTQPLEFRPCQPWWYGSHRQLAIALRRLQLGEG